MEKLGRDEDELARRKREARKVEVPELNNVELNGVCFSTPTVKPTPYGDRVFFLLHVPRTRQNGGKEFKESAYVPMIAWDRAAQWCKALSIGRKVSLGGHISTWRTEDGATGVGVTVTQYSDLQDGPRAREAALAAA